MPQNSHLTTLTRRGVGRLVLVALCAVALAAAGFAARPAGAAVTFFSRATLQQVDSGYSPQQLQTAYNLSPLLSRGVDGTGQTIALIEVDRFAMSDIQQFDAQYGLPDPSVQEYYYGGTPFRLPNQGEATLDLEWAHAMAPAASLQVYYLDGQQADSAAWRELGQTIDTAVSNGAKDISLSFGTCGPSSGASAARQAFARALAAGVSVFVSSGDDGARPGPVRDCGKQLGVGYPASDPSIVAVGGTSLQLNDDNTIASETGWQLSGGGMGKPLPRPMWQLASTLHPGKYRAVPDVSFLGDPATGAAVYYRGKWHQVGGTSLGAPAWAGIWSLVQENGQQAGKTVGAAPTLIYRIGNSSAYARAFHDITVGYNGHYHAQVGWDAVTGWGTPNVAALANAVLSLS